MYPPVKEPVSQNNINREQASSVCHWSMTLTMTSILSIGQLSFKCFEQLVLQNKEYQDPNLNVLCSSRNEVDQFYNSPLESSPKLCTSKAAGAPFFGQSPLFKGWHWQSRTSALCSAVYISMSQHLSDLTWRDLALNYYITIWHM